MTKSLRIAIEVQAGIVPGQPIPEHTKKFFITSDMWYAEGDYADKQKEAKEEILKIYGYAQEYARNLMNPQMLNWVHMDWIYF